MRMKTEPSKLTESLVLLPRQWLKVVSPITFGTFIRDSIMPNSNEGSEFASSTTADPEAVKREADRTVPPEYEMEKAETPEPQPNAYAPSPSGPATVTATHDRDSVQPGSEPRGVYAPEAKLADGSDAPSPE